MKIQRKDIVFPIAVLSLVAGGLLVIDCIIASVALSNLAAAMPTEYIVFLAIFLAVMYICGLLMIPLFFMTCQAKIVTKLKTCMVMILSVSSTVVGIYLTTWTIMSGNYSALATAVFCISIVMMGLSIFWLSGKDKKVEKSTEPKEEK